MRTGHDYGMRVHLKNNSALKMKKPRQQPCRTLPLPLRFPTPILLFVPIKKPTRKTSIHSDLLYSVMYTIKYQYIETNLWLNVFESQRNSKNPPLPLLMRASLCYLCSPEVSRGLFFRSSTLILNQINLGRGKKKGFCSHLNNLYILLVILADLLTV